MKKPLLLLSVCLSISATLFSQAGNPPVAVNDTVNVFQPNVDTINIVAKDTALDGDSICLTAVFGSPDFIVLNCANVIYTPDSNFTGKDSCWYVICDTGGLQLCDTGMIIVNVSPNNTASQLLQNGKVWNVCEWFAENPTISITLTLGKDTAMGNYSYKQVMQYPQFPFFNDTAIAGWIREDSLNKVFFLENNPNQVGPFCYREDSIEILLYDFSLKVGDSLNQGNLGQFIVDSTGTISYLGIVRKTWHLHNSINFSCNYFYYIIEGIGDAQGGLLYPLWGEFENGFQLSCVTLNDTIVYPDSCINCYALGIPRLPPPALKIYPNPATDELFITATGVVPESLSIYDVRGKELLEEKYHRQINISALSAGLYFIEVKGKGFSIMNKFVKQ